MAAPTITSSGSGNLGNTTGTTHPVALPSGTVNVGSANAVSSAHVWWAVAGGDVEGASLGTVVQGTSGANPTPPAISGLASGDYLFATIALMARITLPIGFPSGMTGGQEAGIDQAGGAGTRIIAAIAGIGQTSVTGYTPANWTSASPTERILQTLAIAAGSGGELFAISFRLDPGTVTLPSGFVQLAAYDQSGATLVIAGRNTGGPPPGGLLEWDIAPPAEFVGNEWALSTGIPSLVWDNNYSEAIGNEWALVAPSPAAEGSGSVVGVGDASGSGARGSSGSGPVEATATTDGQGYRASSGEGFVTAVGELAGVGLAGVGGSGSISATGEAEGAGRTSAEGSGAVAAVADASGVGSASARGSGSIVAAGALIGAGDAPGSADGAGSVSAVGLVAGAGSVAKSGAGSVASIGVMEGAGLVERSGSGSVAAAGVLAGTGSAPAPDAARGSGVVAGVGELVGAGSTLPAGSGSVAAAGVLVGVGAGRRSGAGSIEATGEAVGRGSTPFLHPPGTIRRVGRFRRVNRWLR